MRTFWWVGAGLGVWVGGWGAAGCSDPAEKLASSDPAKRIEGLRELSKKNDDEAVQKVAAVVKSEDVMVAAEAVRSLGDMRRTLASRALRDVASQEKREAVRQEAVLQLGRQQDPEALRVLRQVVQSDPDPRVRAAAATSLARQRSLPDVMLLVEVAANEEDVVVQARAVGAVERLIGVKFGYNPAAPKEERMKVIERMRNVAATAATTLQQGRGARPKN